MKRLQMYQVFPSVPEPLKFLEDLSRNMWWCWHMDAIELFRRINPHIWRQSGRNPILFLYPDPAGSPRGIGNGWRVSRPYGAREKEI